jgi:APA family basic amino acid/polyamine antiporter
MFFVRTANWSEFAPFGWTGINLFGFEVAGQHTKEHKPLGMIAGAGLIVFAYLGFDAVSTQAEEARNPKRDLPIGILGSLLICTVLYVALVAVLTGMVRYDEIDAKAGVSIAFKQVGLPWAEFVVETAGIAGLTSVLLVGLLASARVLMAMSRDGLLPSSLADVHARFGTPWKSTLVVGFFGSLFAGFLPLGALLELTNIGTLFAFSVVCGAVLVMRYINPDAPRPFRCPFVPVVPVLGILSCLLLMISLPAHNWDRLFGWMALGLVIYFCYGRRHSVLRRNKTTAV